MFLSIIITTYKEKERDILPLIWSIENQKFVDRSQIEVVIVNDAGEPLQDSGANIRSILTGYAMQYVVRAKNGGSSQCRNTGIQLATGKWITFIDADDLIYSVTGLQKALNTLTGLESADLVRLRSVVETAEGTEQNDPFELVTLHGAFFKKEFLERNDILFGQWGSNEDDNDFMVLFRSYDPRVIALDEVFYFYCYNLNGMFRNLYSSDFEKYLRGLVSSIERILKEVTERGRVAFIREDLERRRALLIHWQYTPKDEELKKKMRETIDFLSEILDKKPVKGVLQGIYGDTE